MSKIESAMRIVLQFNEALNRRDVAGMMQLMSDECVFESPGPAPDGAVYTGKEEVTRYWHDFFHKSPHAHIQVEDIIGLGERCIMRWKYHWVDEEGEKGHVRGIDIFRVRADVICEKLSYVKG